MISHILLQRNRPVNILVIKCSIKFYFFRIYTSLAFDFFYSNGTCYLLYFVCPFDQQGHRCCDLCILCATPWDRGILFIIFILICVPITTTYLREIENVLLLVICTCTAYDCHFGDIGTDKRELRFALNGRFLFIN